MAGHKQDFALGLALIIFVGLFLATVIYLAPSMRADTRPVVVHFRHEEGLAPLKEGSQVLLSGAIEIGSVTHVEPREVEVESPRGPRRRMVIAVIAEVDTSIPLYGDCEITTDMPLVGGSGTMVIANVGTPGIPLPPDHINGRPPQGMAAFAPLSRRLMAEGGMVDRLDTMLDPEEEGSLLNKVKLSLSDINAMTAALRMQLSVQEQKTLLGKIHLIMDDLNLTTGAIREQMQAEVQSSLLAKLHDTLDTLHANLSEGLALLQENRPVVRRTLAHVEHTARVLDEEMLPNLRAELDPANTQSLLAKMHRSMDQINTALADVQVITESGKRMLVLNRPRIEHILAKVTEMSEALAQTSKDIQRNPARLLKGPSKTQENQLAVLTAAHDFAQAATDLDTAAARLQAIIALWPAAGRVPETDDEINAIYEALRSAFEKFQRAEAFFWEEMK
ncbi:MAG: hypothetical protein ABIG44_03595 [Planctomycetota bacterium]